MNHLVECTWSSWEEWSACSKTCGEGKRSSKRISEQASDRNHGLELNSKTILEQPGCPAEDIKEEVCNVTSCPGINLLLIHKTLLTHMN